uniref:Uncharacterized protein n=1 Tax=Melastoma candidum TaxID=119954 RepID=A0ACB9S094_9MYRT|nr:hypothetical protein MLD38_002532 [Melastoma candidum]
MDPSALETLSPSRYVTLTVPSPGTSPHPPPPPPPLRLSVLDSPFHDPSSSMVHVAGIRVPPVRSLDWTFSTEPGLLQLLLTLPSSICRLIVIDALQVEHQDLTEHRLVPLVEAFSPKRGIPAKLGENAYSLSPEVVFLNYEDGIVASRTLEVCIGDVVGEMLVEDVEMEVDGGREFRRRLRFKRMPNLVQSQVRIVPKDRSNDGGGSKPSLLGKDLIEFGLYDGDASGRDLVQPYLGPMVASLSLMADHIEMRSESGLKVRVLCCGIGGGSLVRFLSEELGFEVVGVEADEAVLNVARKYFGLKDSEYDVKDRTRLVVGDAIQILEKIGSRATTGGCSEDNDGIWVGGIFDAVMVDLDSGDVRSGVVAPPLEFVEKSVFLAARRILCDRGILVVNVIPPNKLFYQTLMEEMREVFLELHEIDVGNEENFVLIGAANSIKEQPSAGAGWFVKKLNAAIPGELTASIKKVW